MAHIDERVAVRPVCSTCIHISYRSMVFAVLAACAFAPTFYRIWAQERLSLSEVEAHLAPRLRIEFDPLQPKFLSSTPTLGGVEMLYVRVLARAVSPTVKNCRAYLQRVSQLDGGRHVAR
jgi:hypothetical protein